MNIHVDMGLVSFSHWGPQDIGPYGALVTHDNRIQWFKDYELISEMPCDSESMSRFMQAIRS